jgi:formiminotetrahydrofolate cyclodeaminase
LKPALGKSNVYDSTATIDDFLNASAARQPTPGGGSVAALAGALAASMGEMVVNYSIGKKGLEEFAERLKTALGEFHRARLVLVELMVEDQQAYESLSAARKIAEASERAAAMRDAAMICIRVPQAIGAASVAILEIAERIVDIANPYLLSDLAVCADLAMATTRCAIYNVKVNLPQIADGDIRGKIEQTNAHLLSRGIATIQRVSPRIWERIGKITH